ncbi:MAG: hypothetical protein BIFFINMI_02829 [Phycisphaerae bacterium]|nr:hypothetical protein [Phycisphaerae bacterium]
MDRHGIRRLLQRLNDQQQLQTHRNSFVEAGPARAPGHSSPPSAPWSDRYLAALGRYENLDVYSDESLNAVADGLMEWAKMTPQQGLGCDGHPAPVNKWGLGAERGVIRAIVSRLVASGQRDIADRVRSELADLMQTAAALDEACLNSSSDPAAVERLAGTARMEAKLLAKLLGTIHFVDSVPVIACVLGKPTAPASSKKRGAPRRQDPKSDRQLMDDWKRARGKGGMSRKEFCQSKGIALKTFVRAQDRVRKQVES